MFILLRKNKSFMFIKTKHVQLVTPSSYISPHAPQALTVVKFTFMNLKNLKKKNYDFLNVND